MNDSANSRTSIQLNDMDNQSGKIWHNHSAGISTILYLRGEQQFQTELGRHLFRWINPQLATKDLAYGSSWAYENAPDFTFPREAGAQANRAVLHLIKLVRRFHEMHEEPLRSSHRVDLQNILSEICAHEHLVQNLSFAAFQPSRTARRAFILPESSTPFMVTVAYFDHLNDAINWLFYWTIRFRLLRLRLDCAKEIWKAGSEDSSASEEKALLDQLGYVGEQICGVVAFYLGQVNSPDKPQLADPFVAKSSFARALWALTGTNAIAGTPEIDASRPAMRRWALDSLLQIGSIYGIKQAYAYHDYFCGRGLNSSNARHNVGRYRQDYCSVKRA